MKTAYSQMVINSPAGLLTLRAQNGKLCGLHFGGGCKSDDILSDADREVLAWTQKELSEYFAGERKNFTIPIFLSGTAFQQKIWGQLRKIPWGEVRSYGKLAAEAGSPKGARAAGMACHNNPIGIIVPCHRVLSSSGKLTGFAGGLDTKRILLELEGIKWKE